MTQKKRLTQRQKTERARIKKHLQVEGILPPDKPRLDRRKFAAEVLAEYEAMDPLPARTYLQLAIGCMVGPDMGKVTPEEVGVLKLLKIAVETKRYMDDLAEEGRTRYTIGEYIDKVVLPIKRL